MGLRRQRLIASVMAGVLLGACGACDAARPRKAETITIADLTGLGQDYARQLVRNLDLHVRIEAIDVGTASRSERLARDVVLRQHPPAGAKVPAGSDLTLFVPPPRNLRPAEKEFRLLTHCGLSLPLRFDHRRWLPVDRALRRSINPPDGFSSDGFYDDGTIRRLDEDSIVYTSSSGVQVRYEPTSAKGGSCE